MAPMTDTVSSTEFARAIIDRVVETQGVSFFPLCLNIEFSSSHRTAQLEQIDREKTLTLGEYASLASFRMKLKAIPSSRPARQESCP